MTRRTTDVNQLAHLMVRESTELMKTFPIFLSVAGAITGVVIFAGLAEGSIQGYYADTWVYALVAIVLISGGFTFLWKLTGFRGLRPK